MTKALQVSRNDAGEVAVTLREDVADSELGDGDVTIDIEWSGINYKDGLALAGNPGVMRTSPLIPGIDLVGTVASSRSARWSAGDPVVLNGWGAGETRNGGLATRAIVDGEWLVALPATISAKRAAAIGTAGFTAALSALAIGGDLGGEILVTGASGGVGSIAIALLAAAGRRVIASTGSPEHRDYLLGLGATGTIDRAELEEPGRPLQKQRWAGVIDSVGGATLANVLAQTNYGGIVAACGLVGGSDLPTTVMPFILRGVVLAGINSVECPRPRREAAWALLARDLDLDLLDSLTTTIPLDGAIHAGEAILRGELRGRTVVDVRN
ncbi:MAG TPA: MDR family oxidoreductase [Galbitalea sp.]|jgi:acrylyl-CoA reductase (NADPH)|nr:MDR family oxidoreductase [Galbitalea sp.]